MIQKQKLKRVEDGNRLMEDTIYNTGDLILLKNEVGSKMDSVYVGPFKILQDLGPNVEIQTGSNTDIIHKSRVKHFRI